MSPRVPPWLLRDGPPLVIAEVGIAHGGDLGHAMRYVDAVVRAGVDAVKFQCHIPAAEMTRDHPWWDTISRCALTAAEEAELYDYCDDLGMPWLSTPFSAEAVERLVQAQVEVIKVGSGELLHRPMLEAIRAADVPIIISTGLHSWTERQAALAILEPNVAAVLRCVSAYPPSKHDGLLAFGRLGPDEQGISDHSPTIWTAVAAAAMGARVIEKHVKLSDADPDADVAISTQQLAELVDAVDYVWHSLEPAKVDDSRVRRLARRDRREDYRRAP